MTVLEKRNADLISESNLVKNMIKEAVDHNNEMIHTMDTILNSAMSAIHSSRNDNLSNISDAVVSVMAATYCDIFAASYHLLPVCF